MAIRNRSLDGRKFRRQSPIGPYVVDFVCKEAGLVIELDGQSHDFRREYDAARTRYLATKGYRVIRFSNEDVVNAFDGVIARIREALS